MFCSVDVLSLCVLNVCVVLKCVVVVSCLGDMLMVMIVVVFCCFVSMISSRLIGLSLNIV